SMVAYVAGAVGILRLVRGALAFPSEPDTAARLAGWFAALIYAANPNLIYLQTIAMTEPLYLAFFIWAIVFFNEFAQQAARRNEGQSSPSHSLTKCGFSLAGAELTRYDGWFAALVIAGAASLMAFRVTHRRDLQPFCCSGRPCPSTCCRLRMAACPYSFQCGGRFPITTSGMECNYCRHSPSFRC